MMGTKEKNMSELLDNLNKKSVASRYESPIIPVHRDPEELENDPKFIMSNDERIKKSSIYHPPVKSSYIPTSTLNNKCKEMAGDQYKYTLGVPMTWNEFMAISDDAKKIYINDLLEKYPGISYGVIARFMGSGWKSVKRVLDGIGIKQWKFAGNKTQMVYSRRLNEKVNSDKPNLEIIRKNEIRDLPRFSYKELMKWNDDDRVKTYIQNVLDKYNKALTINNMAELLQCSTSTISKLYKKYNIELIPNYTKSGPSKEYKELFKNEMLSKPCGDKPRKCTKHSKPANDNSIYGKVEIKKKDDVATKEDDAQKLFDEFVDRVKEVAAEKEASSNVNDQKPDVDISMIEFTSDAMDISYILNKYGFTGKVKIRVEKI